MLKSYCVFHTVRYQYLSHYSKIILISVRISVGYGISMIITSGERHLAEGALVVLLAVYLPHVPFKP